jgi:DNA-binding winged helix-turn-helix (wHTH) protein
MLKNGLEWLKRQGLKNIPADDAGLIQGLLNYEPIRRYCHNLWIDLTPAEQTFLANLDHPAPKADVAQLLQASGLILSANQRWRLFSPLWETYLKQNIWLYPEAQPLQIELEPTTRRVRLQWRGRKAETVISRPLVFDLLRVLAATPGQMVSKDDLINVLYPGEKALDVMDDALFQLVTALRKSLDRPVKEVCPAMTRSCIENMRGIGYRLIVDLPTSAADQG